MIDKEVLFISNADTTYKAYKISGDVKLAIMIIPADNRFLSEILKSLKIKDYDKKMDKLVKKYNLNYYSFDYQTVKVYII